MQEAAADAGVQIVAGDTKVVERGGADGVFINTTGIGRVREGIFLSANQAKPGDAILVSGTLGDHGIAILAEREGLQFETQVTSDSAALHTLVDALLEGTRKIRCMRDPTRGGLSSTLNEIAVSSGVGMELEETAIPVREEVQRRLRNVGVGPVVRGQRGQAGGDCRGFSGAGCVARAAGSSARERMRVSSDGSPRSIQVWW